MRHSSFSVGRKLQMIVVAMAVAIPVGVWAQTPVPSFSDVPATSPLFPAVEYLKSKGIVQGGAKFNPNDKLTRAQAAKILVAPLVNADELKKITKSSFADVAPTAWYLSYTEAAKIIGIVDAAPKFNPDSPVTKAGFIKMLLVSKKVNYTAAFSDFTLGLSTDVPNANDWYYPVMRYAIAGSITAVGKDGILSPSREITRGDMALMYYRLDMYIAGRRTQALLSQTETDITNVLQMLDAKNVAQAEFASARAVIASRGALLSRPNENIVKGAVKVAEGFQSLVRGYKAGITGQLDIVIQSSKDAYAAADKAKAFSPGLATVTDQMKTIAKNMADEARKLKAQPASTPAK